MMKKVRQQLLKQMVIAMGILMLLSLKMCIRDSSYLASFAKINKYGFIEAPYRRVDKETGVVTDRCV